MKILNTRLLLLLSIPFLQMALYGQTNAPNIIPPSPKSENFLRFGNIPVNYNTGAPDISIPLYTIKCGTLEVPITLRYHVANVRPGGDPSDIGFGWVLDVGGQISRTVMGMPDDLFPTPPTKRSSTTIDQRSRTDFQYLIDCTERVYDPEYDIFNYSFSSENGKFLIDKNAGVFQAHQFSYKPLKFDFTLQADSKYVSGYFLSTIKANDATGNSYTFGDGEIESSTSVTSPYCITTWLLKKISDVNQVDNINFTYSAIPDEMYPTVSPQASITGDDVKQFCITGAMSELNLSVRPNITCGPQAAYTSYICRTIKQITFNNGKVVFDLSNNNKSIDGFTVYGNDNKIIKKITLNKSDFGTYNHKKLNEIRIYDNSQSQYASYQLKYNETLMNSSDRTGKDYWGYDNNTIEGCTNRQYSYHDCTNPSIYIFKTENPFIGNKTANGSQAEVLTKIIYPTKGETEFIYEGNSYSGVGNGSGDIQFPGGGLRVQSIIDRSTTGNENKRSFQYEGGCIDYSFDNSNNYATTTYTIFPYYCNYYFYRNRSCSNSINPELGANNVRYSKITEFIGDSYLSKNNGKIVYYYKHINPNGENVFSTNIENDEGRTIITNLRDWDKDLLYQKDIYKQNADKSYAKVLNEITEYDQRFDGTFPNLKIFRTMNFLNVSNIRDEWQTLVSLRNTFGDPVPSNYNLFGCYDYTITVGRTQVRKKTTLNYFYNQNQVDSVSSYTTYSYDNPSHNFVTKEETSTSKGDKLTTEYKYPSNFNSAGNIYQTMIDKNMVSPVIEQIKSKYSNNITTFIQSTKNNYGYFQCNTIIAPAYMETKTGTNYETRLNYNAYDKNGNLTDVSKTGGIHTVYLWSYNYQYPVAKIDGISYTDLVNNYYSQSNIDALAQTAVPGKSQIDGIRMALNGAYPLISTYTYSPLVGLVTATDPRGVTTNYTYDTFNRLYLARNDDKNVIGRYRYGYQNAPDNGQGGYTVPTASVTPGATSYAPGATGSATLGSVSGGTGSYSYSWYLKDSSGNTLWSSLNTTTTSVSYPCSQTGTLTVQCVITDNGTGIAGTVSANISVTNVTYSCSFTMQSGFNNITSNISCDNLTSTYYLVFYSTIIMQPYSSYFVANICPNCRPSANRTQTVTTGGRTWYITIYANGNMYFTIVSGTALPTGSGVGFGTWSFSK